MKKFMSLGFLVVLVVSLFASVAQAREYDITKGSIEFTLVPNGGLTDLRVTQTNVWTDYNFDGFFTNILIYGNSSTTAHTILINTPRQDDYIVNITLSNVLISATGIPCNIIPGSKVNLFLATGTSNDLRTAGLECPALRASLGGWSTELTIRGRGTLVAVGGAGGAGIGSGSYYYLEDVYEEGGGTITIKDAAVVKAYGGYYAAAIGSGDRVDSVTWAGGIITISSNATVYAQGGTGGAGIGGGCFSESATISIGPSNKVFAASDGVRPAIDDADETVGGNGYVLMLNYYNPKSAGQTTRIYKKTTGSLLASFAPSITYQSIAFSLAATNTCRVRCNGVYQEYDGNDDFLLLTTGLKIFTNVVSSGHVVVNFDMQGGEGGSPDVMATFGSPMPAATAPTNSNTYLSFGGYYLEQSYTTKYYNANMTSARNCDQVDDFILYAQWLDGRVWDGTSKTYAWYNGQTSPYIIASASDLAGLAAIVNGTAPGITRDTFAGDVVNLAQTLDLADFPWTPIGNYAVTMANLFQGTFNGGSKTLSGIFISTNTNYQGLFGYLDSTAIVSNLTLDASITASNHVGTVCGYNNGGTIKACTATNSVAGYLYVGGLAGTSSGTLDGCTSSATVLGFDWVGGLVGNQSAGGKIRNSRCSGAVLGTDSNTYVGGVVGSNAGTVENAIFSSTVTGSGNAKLGGIAGYNLGTINTCLMLGSLSFNSSSYVGGIAGENTSAGLVTNGYYHTDAGISKALGSAAGAYTSVGSFSTVAGDLTATDGTSLLYGDQLHLALNRGVYALNGDGMLLWWTTETTSYPSLTTNRPPFTLSTPLTVPFSWLATYYPGQQANFETIAQYPGTNPYLVWESYLAGLVPTNATSTFTADITLTNETPYVTWSPNDTSRLYTVQGKALLSDSSWGATNSASRFFKVTVEMP